MAEEMELVDDPWFDTQTGALVDGQSPGSIEANGHIVSLRELLTSDEFPYTTQDYDKVDVSRWERDDFLRLGHWALKLVQTSDSEATTALTEQHLQRLYLLGLGPERRTYVRHSRFGGVAEFQRLIGSPVNTPNGQFDSWELKDFVAYATKLERKLGRKPQWRDYDAAHRRSKQPKPSYQVVQLRLGGVGRLHEFLGYADARHWDNEDIIDWGVKVMQANPGVKLSPRIPDILSKRHRGPATKTIVNRFQKWSLYKERVEQAYSEKERLSEEQWQQKLSRVQSLVAEGLLRSDRSNLFASALVERLARWDLLTSCLPNIRPEQRDQLMTASSEGLISMMRKLNPDLTAGHIETKAVTIGVFDDIWPLDDYKEYLKLA